MCLFDGPRENNALTKKAKSKSALVTDHGGPQGYEKSSFLHFLNNRLTNCGWVVSLTRRSRFITQEDSWYSFLFQAESTSGSYCVAGRIR
jgi:hypothetical protein